jgi:hypothetical protein
MAREKSHLNLSQAAWAQVSQLGQKRAWGMSALFFKPERSWLTWLQQGAEIGSGRFGKI